MPDDTPLDYMHRFTPATVAGAPTLLLLHGTGGDENDLLSLGTALLPGAAMLSPRGNVLERGMPRFFRRLAEGVFDQEDLTRRTRELAAFVDAASARYGVDRSRVIAVGFSNGANIAASVLLRGAGTFLGAVLLSPMLPFDGPYAGELSGTPVFIGAGRMDPIAPPDNVERLVAALESSGSAVTVHWTRGGHGITPEEVAAARDWIAALG